jgi:hypothetical protein
LPEGRDAAEEPLVNANKLIDMVLRIVMRKAINKGIDVGVDHAMRGRNADGPKAQHRANRQQAKRAKQRLRMARRIGRF